MYSFLFLIFINGCCNAGTTSRLHPTATVPSASPKTTLPIPKAAPPTPGQNVHVSSSSSFFQNPGSSVFSNRSNTCWLISLVIILYSIDREQNGALINAMATSNTELANKLKDCFDEIENNTYKDNTISELSLLMNGMMEKANKKNTLGTMMCSDEALVAITEAAPDPILMGQLIGQVLYLNGIKYKDSNQNDVDNIEALNNTIACSSAITGQQYIEHNFTKYEEIDHSGSTNGKAQKYSKMAIHKDQKILTISYNRRDQKLTSTLNFSFDLTLNQNMFATEDELTRAQILSGQLKIDEWIVQDEFTSTYAKWGILAASLHSGAHYMAVFKKNGEYMYHNGFSSMKKISETEFKNYIKKNARVVVYRKQPSSNA